MHSEQPRQTIDAGRKIRRLGAGIVIAILLYSAGWYLAASKFESFAKDFMAQNAEKGRNIDCPGFETGGFPFLLGFDCSGLNVTDGDGNYINAGAVRAVARAYAPGSAVFELDGPVSAGLSDGRTAEASWTKFRGMVTAGLSGPRSISLESQGEETTIDLPAIPARLKVSSDDLQLHLRDNDTNLDVAALARNLLLAGPDDTAILPKLSAAIEFSLNGKGAVLQGKPYGDIASGGKIASLKIESENGVFGELSGNFTIDESGYLSGKFKTRLEKISSWSKALQQIFPEADSTIASLEALLRGLAKGKDDVKVTLRVDHGQVSLSFIPLGKLPPFSVQE